MSGLVKTVINTLLLFIATTASATTGGLHDVYSELNSSLTRNSSSQVTEQDENSVKNSDLSSTESLDALLNNPYIYVGETETFGASMFGPSIGGWRVLDPSSTVIANSSSPGGWNVTASTVYPPELTITAPMSALSGVGYRAESPQYMYGHPGSFYLVFDVLGGSNTPPGAPQNLTAKGLDSKVKLNWNPIPAVTSYNVKRSLTTGGPYTTVATGVTNPFHTDTGLTNGVTYYYVVTSISAGGESTNSNQASAVPQDLQVPLDLPTDPPLGILSDPLALPEWMDHLIPLATSSAPSGGSSSGTGISLPYGVIIQNNGSDVIGLNGVGADVSFSRTYRSSLAVANISSPGLPRGWTHNWDYRIVSTDDEAWAPIKLMYPNGAYDTLIPQMSGEEPTGAFTLPGGVPYLFEGVPDLENEGNWLSFTMKGNGTVKRKFFKHAGDTVYRLAEVVDANDSKLVLYYSAGKLTDINATKSNYDYDYLLHMTYGGSGGYLLAISTQSQAQTQLYYTGNLLTSVGSKTNSGNQWAYTYTNIEGSPFLSSVSTLGTNGAIKTTTIGLDTDTGRVTSVTDANSVEQEIEYYAGESGVQTSHPNLQPSSYETTYDTLGRFISSTDDAGYTVGLTYSTSHPANITQVNYPASPSLIAAYDGQGNPTSVTHPDGTSVTTTWEYPTGIPLGRPTQVVSRGIGGAPLDSTSLTYYSTTNASTGQLEGHVATSTTNGLTTNYQYTLLGNIKSVTSPGANGLPATTTYSYLATGAPASSEKLDLVRKIVDPIGRETVFNYDSADRPLSVTDPIGRTTTLTYNNYSQVTKVNCGGQELIMNYQIGGKSPTSFEFDPNTSVSLDQITLGTFSYDNEYSVSATQSFGETTNLAKTVDYGLKGVTNGNNVLMHAFTETPQTRTSTAKIGVGSRSTLWESFYNNAGDVHRVVSPMTYADIIVDSASGDPTAVTSTKIQSPTIYSATNYKDFDYDNFGRLTGAEHNTTSVLRGGASSYTYDSNGFLNKEEFIGDKWDSNSKVEYLNNDQGFVTKMTVKGSNTLLPVEYEYSYNVLGWITQIETKLSGSLIPEFRANYEYDDAGRVVAVRTPISTTIYEYNNLDQVTKQLNLSADGVVDPAVGTAFKYQDPYNGSWHTIYSKFENITYNALGNRIGMSYTLKVSTGYGGNTFQSGTIAYNYSNNRLSSETYTRTSHANVTLQHSYDSVGNLTMLRGATRSHDTNSDQILSIPGFTPNTAVYYDSNGGQTAVRELGMEFDSMQMLARLQTVGTSGGSGGGHSGDSDNFETTREDTPAAPTVVGRTFGYDHNNLRRFTDSDGPNDVFYGYSGSELVWQRITNWEVDSGLVYYLWGPTGPVLEFSQNLSKTLAFNYDPNGSLVGRVESIGLHEAPMLFDGYGKQLWVETDSYVPFRYKGQAGYVSDFESKLVYCWNRYYDPMQGRWISRDPIGLEGGVNTYEYCGGNPIMFVDPTGLMPDDVGEWWFFKDWSWSRYFDDMMNVFRGEGDAINPVNWAKGIGAAVTVIGERGPGEGGKLILTSMWNGLTDWSTPRAFGSSVMSWTLIAAPAPKGVGALSTLTKNARNAKNITYAARVWQRAVDGPMHNFPVIFDQVIVMRGTMVINKANGNYIKYFHNGVINGKKGTYELFGRIKDGKFEVDHRFFRPAAKK